MVKRSFFLIRNLQEQVKTDAAREALRIADELADLIIFHARVQENLKIMSETWDM